MRTYESFVEELRALQAEINILRKEPLLAQSIAFKTWNHALCRLIGAMRNSGHRNTGCQVEGRLFSPASYWETRDPADYFNTALDDTRIELDDIISNYDKHGEPAPSLAATRPGVALAPPAAPRAASSLMPKPGDLTADWLRVNVPFEYVKWASGVIGIVFFAGIAVDRAYESIMSKIVRQGAAPTVANESTAKLRPPAGPTAAAAAPAEREMPATAH